MPCPGAGVRHRKPAGLRPPRRGGLADGTAQEFVGRLAGARYPALRSAGLFGSETGSPRTRAVQGTARVSSRGGGRRAEPGLRTSRQKSPRPKPQKNRPRRGRLGIKKVASEVPPLSITKKEAPGAAQRPAKKEAVARLCPAGVQAAKKPPPPGPPRHPKGFFRRTPFCLSPKKKPLGLLNAPQKKNPRPVYAPQGCRPQKTAPAGAVPVSKRLLQKCPLCLSPKKKPPGLLNAPQKKKPSRIYFAEVICF